MWDVFSSHQSFPDCPLGAFLSKDYTVGIREYARVHMTKKSSSEGERVGSVQTSHFYDYPITLPGHQVDSRK